MTEEEVAVGIAELGKEMGSLKHRVGELEGITEEIHNLTLTMVRLTENVGQTNKSIRDLQSKVEDLEKEPGEHWNQLKSTIITAIASGLVGILLGALTSLI